MFLSLLHVNHRDETARRWLSDTYRVHQRLWMAFPDDASRQRDPFFLGTWSGPPIPDPKPKRAAAGFLFRIDTDASPRILVQSAQAPDWNYAFQNAPHLLTAAPQVREFDPTPTDDEQYRFRLVANVVTRKCVPYADGRKRPNRPELVQKRRAEQFVDPKPIPEALPQEPAARERLLAERWDPWREWLAGLGSTRGFRVLNEPASPLQLEPVYTTVRYPGAASDGPNSGRPSERRYNAGRFEGVLVCTNAVRLREAVVNGIGSAKAFGFGLLSLAPLRA